MSPLQVELLERTRENVEIYFYKTQDQEIHRMLPSAVSTVEEALAAYEKACLPGADSFGRCIYWEGRYVGDIWCYCINKEEHSPMRITQDPGGSWKKMVLCAGSFLCRTGGNRHIMRRI
ncbi:MAG: hypothetical protein K2O06_05245 [Acetatifactor sp.]|nr:hypothetical protein [Acetatifactor sp.]